MIIPLLIPLLFALSCLIPAARQQAQEPPPVRAFYQEVSWSPDGERLGFTLMSGDMKAMKAGVLFMLIPRFC